MLKLHRKFFSKYFMNKIRILEIVFLGSLAPLSHREMLLNKKVRLGFKKNFLACCKLYENLTRLLMER